MNVHYFVVKTFRIHNFLLTLNREHSWQKCVEKVTYCEEDVLGQVKIWQNWKGTGTKYVGTKVSFIEQIKYK